MVIAPWNAHAIPTQRSIGFEMSENSENAVHCSFPELKMTSSDPEPQR